MKDIHKLKLHEGMTIVSSSQRETEALRVPGGWIYSTIDYIPSENDWQVTSQVFVPFTNESQVREELEKY